MTIYYSATDRKPLVKAISEFTGAKAVYLKTPTYAYQIDYCTVTREGNLQVDDMADSEEIEKLIDALAQQGFVAERTEYDSVQQEPVVDGEEPLEDTPPAYGLPDSGIIVSVPADKVPLDTVMHLVEAKGSLIKKTLGVTELPVLQENGKISFAWFPYTEDPDKIQAYNLLVCKLCEFARNAKRVTAKEKPVDNDKYAFRCFLLRLGFIGAEYKAARKILLRNLSGSSAFKAGSKKVAE